MYKLKIKINTIKIFKGIIQIRKMEETNQTETNIVPETTPVPTPSEPTLDNLIQSPLQNPIKESLSADANTIVINEELKELYELVSKKIRLAVANNHFTAESLEVILSKIVETLEEVSEAGGKHLTGIEKRNIGINILRMIIEDLHKEGQINDELYSYFNVGLTYVAPALFYAAKETWKKIQEISDDISQKGLSGCFRRNC